MKLKGFYSSLFTIAIPISLQALLQNFVNMLDTVMIGRLGSVEIAAVGLGNQIFFILNMILFGITSGGGVFIAQFWGKKDIRGIRKSLGLMTLIALFVAIVFTILGIFIPYKLIFYIMHIQRRSVFRILNITMYSNNKGDNHTYHP